MPYGNTRKKPKPSELVNPLPETLRHDDRREYYKTYISERRKRREEAGVCRECGKGELMPHTNLCEQCWWYRLVKVWCPSLRGPSVQETAQRLKSKLASQNCTCAYTGWSIELVTTAQIDHILPVKTHPHLADDVDNMQWVHKDINLMKGGRTRDEFIALCKLITLHVEALR